MDKRTQETFPGPKYGGAKGHSLSGDNEEPTEARMEGSCENVGRQMRRLGEIVKALERQAKELGFCPQGSGNPLNVSEPENDTRQSLIKG